MKKFFIGILVMLAIGVNNSSSIAQSVVREGKTFKSVGTNRAAKDTLVTSFTFEDSKGNKYPIIINKGSGRCYCYKISSKTGKTYKFYMKKEVSQAVCKELGITYIEKEK